MEVRLEKIGMDEIRGTGASATECQFCTREYQLVLQSISWYYKEYQLLHAIHYEIHCF